MSNSHKAWIYNHEGYPRGLSQATQSTPSTLSPKEVRVRVKAAAINPVDIQLMNLPIWPYLPTFVANPTHVSAEDFSGIVEAAGQESGYKAGDEVFGMVNILATGTLQEIIQFDASNTPLTLKPSTWSWEQAAALPLVYLTARTVIASVEPFVASTKKPKVAVLGGSSSTGIYMVHLAASRGWDVLASCSGRNADFVREMGARDIIDYTAASVPKRVRAFNPDAIIDCVGGTECLGLARRYVTIVGDKTSRANMGGAATYLWNPRMFLRSLAGRYGLSESYDCVNLEMKKEYLEETLRLPTDKIIIDSTFSFNEAEQAFERLNTSRARGKVVIKVSG
ncbi:alcohol dehydrogenase [Myriangium duriaei CBS 260.36]|uniref:Alcohol dehydrogenase n=1 Tax=Myriangium duriaei CBS 260.36 TaxID=1168546 RepID=A0A9P4MPC0_9PEZI|nr:alcohol dehydrogenase [Myriangium duriaei CBS 260.36]